MMTMFATPTGKGPEIYQCSVPFFCDKLRDLFVGMCSVADAAPSPIILPAPYPTVLADTRPATPVAQALFQGQSAGASDHFSAHEKRLH